MSIATAAPGDEDPLIPKSSEPTFNAQELEYFRDLAHNAMSMRSDLLRKFMDPRRDYDKECGYPTTEQIRADDYKRVYDRDPIGARVVDCLPDECWKIQPTVYEDEDAESVTEFEEAWDNLGRSLRGGSFYQDEDGSPVWDYLNRLDRLCGVGSFGVLLLGFNDLRPGETLEKPLEGEMFKDGTPDISGYNDVSDEFGRQYADQPSPEAQQVGTVQEPEESSPQKKEKGKKELKLLFMRVFDESLVQITQYESNMGHPRFGQPIMYTLTFTDPNNQSKGGVGLPLATQRVHWSRVIHVADNVTSSEIFGEPRMKAVWNRLIDLTKLYGGSAEMYWKGAFPGLSLNIDPKMGGDIPVDSASIRDAMWKYTNSLQRWFALAGVTATSLSPQVVDPTQQINVQIDAICIKLSIPRQVFIGAGSSGIGSGKETESLTGTWNERLVHRLKTFITPRIIIPFVDRLIQCQVLPEPQGYSISWPEIGVNRTQKIADGNAILSGLGTYASMGLETVIELIDVYTRLFGFSEEEAKAILERRTQTLEDKKAQEQEAADMEQLSQLESAQGAADEADMEEPPEESAPPEEPPPEE